MFRTSSGFDKLLDKATSNLLLEVDIFSVVQICDLIRQKDCPPKYALTALKRKLSSPNPHTVYYSLQVLESIVKNCGSPIHDEISTKEFMESLRDLAKSTPHENVREKILELVQTWAHAFRKYPNYRAVQDVLNIMKAEGMKFPSLIEADTMFTADTAPEWQDGGCCNRCRVEFGLMNRKHHCRACGQIFCGKCSSKVTPLPKFGIEKEVRVCDSCFDKFGTTTTGTSKPAKTVGNSELLDDPLQKAIEASIADQTSKGSFNKDKKNNKAKQSSTTAPTTTPTRKTPAELEQEENEQLELALAISQSEAEAKEREKMERNNKRQQIGQLVTQSPEVISNGTNSILKKENQSPTGGIIDENNSSSSDPDLSRYLNRSYWEERQKSSVNETSAPINSISSLTPSAPMKETNSNRNKGEQSEELDNFVAILREQIDMFVNRMKSDSSRGRHISNDTSVQGLFMNLTAMHSQLLNYIHLMDDGRSFYESLQDKLTQSRDARDALDSLRNEHTALRRAAAEEAERQRQIQMAIKLNDMRQKKHQYLQYQQNLAIQRVQEEQRVMQQRMEMQRGGLMGQIPGQPQQQQGYYNYQGIHGQGGQVIPGQVHGQMPGITGQVHGQMPGITGQYQMTGQHHQIQGNMMMGGVPNPIQQQQQPLDQQQHPQQQQQHYAYHHPAGAGQNQSVQGQVQGPMQDPGQLHINQNQQQQQQYYIPQHQQPQGGMPTTTSPPDLNNAGQGQGQPQVIQQQPPPQQSQQVEIANLIDF